MITSPVVKAMIPMADYAAMYRRLFQSQTQATEILMKAQQDVEEMYISSPDPEIRVLDTQKSEDE